MKRGCRDLRFVALCGRFDVSSTQQVANGVNVVISGGSDLLVGWTLVQFCFGVGRICADRDRVKVEGRVMLLVFAIRIVPFVRNRGQASLILLRRCKRV